MSAHCCGHDHDHAAASPTYRRILWIALAVNLAMFAVEIGAGLAAQSASLLADSLDFLGDAANYGIALFVLGMALQWRARAALIKAASMGIFGLWVAVTTIQHALAGTVPEAPVMGAVGAMATAICARCGSARATTRSATSQCCWRPWACSARAPAGPTTSWLRSWRAFHRDRP